MNHAAIERAILALLDGRAPGKTICPSEVARALAGDAPAQWRPMMPAVRAAADLLAREGRLRVLQRGQAVASAVQAVGPIRLARPAPPGPG
ncbi:Protein of unknown function (DUF3253) [Acidovorax sp. CF316]|uniref:DUF3253 domain-containing protein n=1 Tax=Acidovorax sp. CF316 TaxID=1144317 RepID=UPI00026BC30B|nr:DUF3253 domain-containing protein [Acidovorax sp. CF316]EJE53117.1 Protein of unknown function (DUF3253) [Acidovorax sp. CF316]